MKKIHGEIRDKKGNERKKEEGGRKMRVVKENLSRSEKRDGESPKRQRGKNCFWREIRRNEGKRGVGGLVIKGKKTGRR